MRRKDGLSLLITFEGIDGCGKSTQANMAYRFLLGCGLSTKLLREPGSTRVAERIRRILLDKRNDMEPITETLLYEAARSEITSKEIIPTLKEGTIVLCDRFYDSTTAYQGFGRQLDISMVRRLHRVAVGNLRPHLTFLFDVDLKTARQRLEGQNDRMEMQSKMFFDRVRKGFLELARRERRRIRIIDGSRSVEEVFVEVQKHLTRKLRRYGVSLPS